MDPIQPKLDALARAPAVSRIRSSSADPSIRSSAVMDGCTQVNLERRRK
jgi:hypothetical protein